MMVDGTGLKLWKLGAQDLKETFVDGVAGGIMLEPSCRGKREKDGVGRFDVSSTVWVAEGTNVETHTLVLRWKKGKGKGSDAALTGWLLDCILLEPSLCGVTGAVSRGGFEKMLFFIHVKIPEIGTKWSSYPVVKSFFPWGKLSSKGALGTVADPETVPSVPEGLQSSPRGTPC